MGQAKRLSAGESRWKDGLHWCSRCRDYRDPDLFLIDPSRPDGLSFYCSPCRVARNRKRQYKDVDYDQMYRDRNGVCDVCKQQFEVLCIDHDHSCCGAGKACLKCVRGLLCGGCNTAIGLMKDNVDTLSSAIIYLTAHHDKLGIWPGHHGGKNENGPG